MGDGDVRALGVGVGLAADDQAQLVLAACEAEGVPHGLAELDVVLVWIDVDRARSQISFDSRGSPGVERPMKSASIWKSMSLAWTL